MVNKLINVLHFFFLMNFLMVLLLGEGAAVENGE